MNLAFFLEKRAYLVWGIVWGISGLAMAGAFTLGAWLPTPLALGAMYVLCFWGLWHIRPTRSAWLSRLMIIIYTAPFTQAWPLLFRDRALWWPPFNSNYIRLLLDHEVNRSMVNLGFIGLVALMAGLYLACTFRIHIRSRISAPPRPPRHLRTWSFLIVLAAAFLFSWLNASQETILSAKTITPDGVAHQYNFNSAYLLSYILLILLWVDTEGIGKLSTKRIRRGGIYLSMLFIVFYFQLLRGNRESIGLLFGLAGLYLTEPGFLKKGLRRDKIQRWLVCGVTLGILMVLFVKIQHFRETLFYSNRNTPELQQNTIQIVSNNLDLLEKTPVTYSSTLSNAEVVRFYEKTKRFYPQNTWGACLLTNLSLANQYKNDTLPMEWGKTYWQYALSLPPGILMRSLGIERPIERNRNPAWWFKDVSAGGAHIVTIAFVNFRAWGVAILLLLYGLLIGWTDRCSQGGWVKRLWYGSFYLVCFHWFWYGDMFFIRGAMAYLLFLGLYALLRRMSWSSCLSNVPDNDFSCREETSAVNENPSVL